MTEPQKSHKRQIYAQNCIIYLFNSYVIPRRINLTLQCININLNKWFTNYVGRNWNLDYKNNLPINVPDSVPVQCAYELRW